MPHLASLRSLRRAPLVLFLLGAGLTCRDKNATGPGLPGRGALDVAPVFESVVQGGPLIPLARVRALLIAQARESRDTASAEARFEGDSAVVRFEVMVAAPSELFALEVEAIDADGTVIFRGTDTVRVAPGRTAARGAPVLRYVAPDTAVTSLVLTPLDTILEAGDSVQVTAIGLASDETEIATPHLGWLARDASTARVSASGMVTALDLERKTWIVARTFTGVTDSVHVTVRGGVADVVISPDTAVTIMGNIVAMYAEAKDAVGTVLSGEGREVTWTTLDPQLVSLAPINESPNGIASTAVTGLAPGVARIVATAGTRADTAHARVESNAGIVTATEVRPESDTLASLGDTVQLLAASYDAQGALAAGVYTWTVHDPLVAGVSPLGTVVAMAPGETWIVVEDSGGTRDSALVVVNQRVATVAITPFVAQVRLGSTLQYEATPVDGRGNPMESSRPVAWATESQVLAQLDESGLAIGAGVGEETVLASIDGVVGRALLTVVSPVARVVVSPRGLTLGALGASGLVTATAYDSAGAPVDAPVVWEIANPAVATLSDVQGASATVTAAGNGNAFVRATVLGTEGQAAIHVQQKLAAIALSPNPILVGIGGAAQLTPHPLDANGFAIGGFPVDGYLWSVAEPTIASVDRGFVQGLQQGATSVSASADGIASAAVTVDVTDAAPAAISFGRDTIPVGFADSVDVPIFLSRPNQLGPVDVHLSVGDSTASVEPAMIRFDPGVTRRVVKVRAHAVASASLMATDSLTGYAAAFAIIAARPGVSLDPATIVINANDERAVRVLLTEPAPAGGIELLFDDGTADIVAISPRPVLIPGGHLAAEVVLHGVRAGEATVEPVAPGVRGVPAHVVVADAVLAFTRARADSGCSQYCETLQMAAVDATAAGSSMEDEVILVGAGQYLADGYRQETFGVGLGVRTPEPMHQRLVVTVRATDPTMVRVDDTVVIGEGETTASVGLGGLRPGEVTLTASAPGWTDATQRVLVTTPHLHICCVNGWFQGQEEQLSVSVTDSLGTEHPRISSLVTRVSSSDPKVVAVLDSAPVIAIDASSNWNVRVLAVAPGSAWIRVKAGGHVPDSVQVHVTGSSFELFAAPTIGEAQRNDGFAKLVLPMPAPLDRTFTLKSSAPGTLKVPASVTIPAGGSYAAVPVEGVSTGVATITASTPEMESRSRDVVVTSSRIVALVASDSIPLGGTRDISVYAADSLGNVHATASRLVVRIRPENQVVLAADPDTVVIDAGTASATATLRGLALGSTTVRAQASSYEDGWSTVSVVGSPLRVNDGRTQRTIGVGQRRSGSLDYVRLTEPRATDVQVGLSGAKNTQVPATVTVQAGSDWADIPVVGLTPGVDTLLVTAMGYEPDTLVYTVTAPHLLDGQTLPSSVPFGSAPSEVRVRPGDAAGEAHISEEGVTVRVRTTNPDVLAVDSAWIHIPRGGAISTPVRASFVGLGVAALIFEDSAGVYAPDTSRGVAVTAPPLTLGSSLVSVGMRQETEDFDQWVSIPVAQTAPLMVQLSTSDPRVAGVPDTVAIPAGATTTSFRITGGDATGTVQLRAQAAGHHPATAMVEVGRPSFLIYASTWTYTVDLAQIVTVQAVDHRFNPRRVTEDVIVRLESSNPMAAKLDSTTVTILAGTRGSGEDGLGAMLMPIGVGTTVLSASDARADAWAYRHATSDTIEIRRPDISLGYAELVLGVGQYANDDLWVSGTVDTARTVKLVRTNIEVADLPDTVQIPALESYGPLRVTARAAGVDTLLATMPGYIPDTTLIRVDVGTIELETGQGLPFQAVQVGGSTMVRLVVRNPDGDFGGPVAAATTWTLSADPSLTFSADTAGLTPIDRITVPADQVVSPWFYVRASSAGTATVSATNPDYRTLERLVRIDP